MIGKIENFIKNVGYHWESDIFLLTNKNTLKMSNHDKTLTTIKSLSEELNDFTKKTQIKLTEIKKSLLESQEEIIILKKQKNEIYEMWNHLKKKTENNGMIIRYDKIDPMAIYGMGIRFILSINDYRTMILNYLTELDTCNLKSALTGKQYTPSDGYCHICGIVGERNYKCASCGGYMCNIVKSKCVKRYNVKCPSGTLTKKGRSFIPIDNLQETFCSKCHTEKVKNDKPDYNYCVKKFRYSKCRQNEIMNGNINE